MSHHSDDEEDGLVITKTLMMMMMYKKQLKNYSRLRVCLVQNRGGEGRDFNEGEGREGEGRRNLIVIYMFGSNKGGGGEGRNFNYKCVWFRKGGEG
jgi:hypothetical protein